MIKKDHVGAAMTPQTIEFLVINGEVIDYHSDDPGHIAGRVLRHLGYDIVYKQIDKTGDDPDYEFKAGNEYFEY